MAQSIFTSDISIQDIANILGSTADEVRDLCGTLIESCDFRHNIVIGGDRDNILVEVLKEIAADRRKVGTPKRRAVWERGWNENLKLFEASQNDRDALTPKFIRPSSTMRWRQTFIQPATLSLESDLYSVVRQWLFKKYLTEVATTYEFGCGTGHNLLALSELFPSMELHGLDFVESAVALVEKVSLAYSINLNSHLFDMANPPSDFALARNSAALSFGSIEQLGTNYRPFIDYLLSQRPMICISVEHMIELYDDNNLMDYLSILYHRHRGYPEGFLPLLQQLESNGLIHILQVNRPFIGNQLIDAYGFVVWRPL